MNRKYIFEDFQLDDTSDREEVNMECGITIPIRSITDLPKDIVKIVNGSVSQTMMKFEKKVWKGIRYFNIEIGRIFTSG